MPRALKVFRTPIGFHDAYVAAPTQKAALEAWGADVNLFARGVAEQVTDPALIKEPLARPGTVIKRPRGSSAEHFASLAQFRPAPTRKERSASTSGTTTNPPPPPRPRPSRKALAAAEEALEQQQQDARAEIAALEHQIDSLRNEITRLRKKQESAASKLERKVDSERRKYEAALERWRVS